MHKQLTKCTVGKISRKPPKNKRIWSDEHVNKPSGIGFYLKKIILFTYRFNKNLVYRFLFNLYVNSRFPVYTVPVTIYA